MKFYCFTCKEMIDSVVKIGSKHRYCPNCGEKVAIVEGCELNTDGDYLVTVLGVKGGDEDE